MFEINLAQGDVLLSMTGTVVDCDHQKLLVFVNEMQGLVGLVTINSQPYPRKGMETQLKVLASDFGFLNHDSYIDCSSLFVKNIDEFGILLKSGQIRQIGNLDSGTMDKVVLAAIDSRFLNRFQKKFFDSSI